MKTFILTITLAVLAGLPAPADEETEIDLEARKRSIVTLEGHIQEREKRLTQLANDIVKLDRRVETQLQGIVNKLSRISDSESSKWRISQVKMEAMEGLASTVEEYQQKRNELVQKMKEGSTAIPPEVLAGDVKSFDEHIDKRVEQILQISKSFTQEANVAKYQKLEDNGYGYGNDWDWDGDLVRISDEYRQNRRDRVMDSKQRRDVIEALEKSIARLEQRVASHKQTLKEDRLSKAENDILQSEMQNYQRQLGLRRSQLGEMMEVSPPATQKLPMNAARDFQDSLRDSVDDLRRDYDSIFEKYHELNRHRDRLHRLKTNLEARKKWMAEYEAKE